jgi:hypothetical protein
MSASAEQVEIAYKKLKRLVYYDKTDLRLRQRLAEFECDPKFEKRLQNVERCLNSESPTRHPIFQNWLSEISFRIVPKSLKDNDSHENSVKDDGTFLSNVTSSNTLEVMKVNYFFDGPIELHLIAVIWIMTEGWLLDYSLMPECCGSRLEKEIGNAGDESAALFVRYHELYARWRDSGIKKAKELLEKEQKSVCILGLDVQQYYYRIRLNFAEISDYIERSKAAVFRDENATENESIKPGSLLSCLNEIHKTFRATIAPFFDQTQANEEVLLPDSGLPIGLCSSAVLANWYLRDFDDEIMTKVRPAYYGRYVDDILIVVPTSNDPSQKSPKRAVANFMDHVLVEPGVIHESKNNRYEILKPGGLYLQQSKCILQYFDSKHSIAGLEKFQKKLEENGSDFLLLPVDEADNSLEDVAYELLYEGSVNKFRSVKGMAENRYELAKHLARQTILHLLTDDPPDPKISTGLQKFFKGRNAVEFYDLWERVFTYFQVASDYKAAKAFAKQLRTEIKRVRFLKSPFVGERLTSHLKRHLLLSQAMAEALNKKDENDLNLGLPEPSDHFRNANLIRHHFVRITLLNYTNYKGSLLSRSVDSAVEIDPIKQKYSPRFVNFDECIMLAYSENVGLGETTEFDWAKRFYLKINGNLPTGMKWASANHTDEAPND